MLHQVGLEVSEVLRHRNALLLTFHEGLQTLWNLNVYAEDSVHLFLELGRVSRLAEDADLARFQSVLESLVATCSVRIEDVPCLLIALAHGLADLLVTISGTADERANFLMTLSNLQGMFPDREEAPIRTALVTSRNAPAHERAIKTLRDWQVRVDEAFFLGGVSKKEILQQFGAHIFFDDQRTHTDPASEVVTSAVVPYREGDDPSK